MSLCLRVFFKIYFALWALARPFLCKSRRLKDDWKMRLIPSDWLENEELCLKTPYSHKNHQLGIDLWLLSASGGEAYLVSEFIKNLEPQERDCSILLTTWTQQGFEVLKRESKAILAKWEEENEKNETYTILPTIYIRFVPLDYKQAIEKAFDIAKPKKCILFETELWFAFLLEAKKRHVDVYVINGRMAQSTYRFYRFFQSICKEIAPKKVLAITSEDAKRFSAIFPSSTVETMYNIKFDRAINELENALRERRREKEEQEERFDFSENRLTKEKEDFQTENSNALPQNIPNTDFPECFVPHAPVYLFASVREEERYSLVPLIRKLVTEKTESIIIIAPRHMHYVQDWYDTLQELGLTPLLASESVKNTKDLSNMAKCHSPFTKSTCIIWDSFGFLKELYKQADCVYVGGSLKKTGGQNFLEAITCGIVPHVGPHLDNFLWAINDFSPSLTDEKLLFIHKNKKMLYQFFIVNDIKPLTEEERLLVQERFYAWLLPKKGTTRQAVKAVL